MRRTVVMLTIGVWLAIAGVVVTAAPAAANPGSGVCTPAQLRNVGGAVPTSCSCLQSLLERRNVGGTGPALPTSCTCLQSLLERRNVGGTGPADGTCSSWLSFGWQFPRFR
jgi:hypothetical protein